MTTSSSETALPEVRVEHAFGYLSGEHEARVFDDSLWGGEINAAVALGVAQPSRPVLRDGHIHEPPANQGGYGGMACLVDRRCLLRALEGVRPVLGVDTVHLGEERLPHLLAYVAHDRDPGDRDLVVVRQIKLAGLPGVKGVRQHSGPQYFLP